MTTQTLQLQGAAAAVADLAAVFGADHTHVLASDSHGWWVRLDSVSLGPTWAQSKTFVLFHVASSYPFADIYPLFVRHDLQRADGADLKAPITTGHRAGPPGQLIEVVQVSRRTMGDPSQQSAARKVRKVLDWIRSQ